MRLEAGLPAVICHQAVPGSASAFSGADNWSIHEAQSLSIISGPGMFPSICAWALSVSCPVMGFLRMSMAVVRAGPQTRSVLGLNVRGAFGFCPDREGHGRCYL